MKKPRNTKQNYTIAATSPQQYPIPVQRPVSLAMQNLTREAMSDEMAHASIKSLYTWEPTMPELTGVWRERAKEHSGFITTMGMLLLMKEGASIA